MTLTMRIVTAACEKIVAVFAVILIPIAISAQSVIVSISSEKDNTLYEDTTGALSNGAGFYLFAGRSSQATNSIRRGVMQFDIDASIPSGAVILDAELTLHMSRTSFGPTAVELHRLLSDWGEGTSDAAGEEGGGALSTTDDATWIHTFYNTGFWTLPGGDFSATLSTSAIVDSNGYYTFSSTSTMIADIQGWLDNPSENFGWIILGDETAAGSSKRFDCRESPVSANRPKLTVTYAIPSQMAIPAMKDNTLCEESTGALSNGAGSNFFVGKTNQFSNSLRRGVIAFDVAGNITAGSLVVGAQLKLNMSKTISGTFPVNLHKLLADWGEGTSNAAGNEGGGAPSTMMDATWIHTFFNSSFWSTAGGDFDPSVSGTSMIAGVGSYTFGTTPLIAADVQEWLDVPGSNFGWLVIGDETTAGSAKRFDSKENSIMMNRPSLIVYFIPPPCCIDIRGDVNNDGANANILDLNYMVNRIFRGGPPAACFVEADVNSDGTSSNVLDLNFLVNRIFRGGVAPEAC